MPVLYSITIQTKKIYFSKTFAFLPLSAYLCRPLINAALVKGLRRLPFTEESRVRIPYVVLKRSLSAMKGFLFLVNGNRICFIEFKRSRNLCWNGLGCSK